MSLDDASPSLPLEVEHEFLAALDLPKAEQRAALESLCAKWPAHAAVLRAWAADRSVARTVPSPAKEPPPNSIGPYRILEVIAEGGMGVVYAAEQMHPVRRRVAVKVIRPGMDSREVLARFDQERQALALMNHPHIAKVLEAGATPEGRPFFAMEFVAGLPITSFVDKNRLTMRERLELFAQVCDGVQHAHQKGVIHRDIKPSNILVTFHDGKAHAKIIDFGVAKATQQPLTEKTVYTHQGQLVGTPEYMSPEQAEMTGTAVDTRSDIYSLGVLLYELLTGSLPFDRDAFRKAGLQGMLRILREQEPEKPSTKVTTIGAAGAELATRRRTDLGGLKRQLRGDLDWITIRALEKDPSRRYQSAGEFAADVLRHLHDEPVSAGPPTLGYRLSKLVRRHKGPIATAAGVLAALVGGLIVSLWLYVEADRAWVAERAAKEVVQRERGRADQEAERALKAEQRLREIEKFQRVAAESSRTEASARALKAVAQRDSILREVAGIAGLTRPLQDLLRRSPEGVSLLASVDALERERALQDLVTEVDSLWPARAERREALQGWLRRARGVITTLGVQQSEIVQAMIVRVEARLAFIDARSVQTLEAPAAAWLAAEDYARRHKRYAGVSLKPQLGLIPLGPDPVSGLLEFAHYGSGTAATRSSGRGLERAEGFSLVFVLIPPGRRVWVGAQKSDPMGPNYDPDAQPNEPLPAQVDVDAFFLSKYELTQAQWRTLSEGDTPSRYAGEDNPVEFVDQPTFMRVLGWHEMEIPTEVEWEYACRAGTTTPWYSGATRDSLLGTPVVANIADVTLLERGAPRDKFEIWDDYRDGMAVHGPTGMLRPNAFGLHDTLGNVFELCVLGAGPWAPDQLAVVRGGAWNRSASWARATARIEVPAAGTRFDNLGVRPLLRLRK